MTNHPPKQRDTRGFTLVEMMVGIAILGIALAIAVPNFNASLIRAQFDRAPAELESDLRLAISEAKARGRTIRLDFGNGGYTIMDAADSTTIAERDLGDHVNMAAAGDPLIFPWGLVQPTQVQISGPHKNLNYQILPTGKVEENN